MKDLKFVLQVAEYKGEYYRQHPVIQSFWEVFFEFPIDMKKKFLGMLEVEFQWSPQLRSQGFPSFLAQGKSRESGNAPVTALVIVSARVLQEQWGKQSHAFLSMPESWLRFGVAFTHQSHLHAGLNKRIFARGLKCKGNNYHNSFQSLL